MPYDKSQYDPANLPGAGIVDMGFFRLAEAFGLTRDQALECWRERKPFSMSPMVESDAGEDVPGRRNRPKGGDPKRSG